MNQLLLKPSRLSRSVTEPNHRLFPPKPAVNKSKSQDQDHILVIDISGTSASYDRQPSFSPPQRSANSTASSFSENPESSGYFYPTSEVDTPTFTTGVTEHSLQREFPARTSSMKKPASLEPQYGYQGKDRNDPNDPNAEVSVAREISISRRQRQLLVPITPKTARQPIQPRINEQSIADESRKSHHLTLEDA